MAHHGPVSNSLSLTASSFLPLGLRFYASPFLVIKSGETSRRELSDLNPYATG